MLKNKLEQLFFCVRSRLTFLFDRLLFRFFKNECLGYQKEGLDSALQSVISKQNPEI